MTRRNVLSSRDMSSFWDLLRESVLVQGLLALGSLGTIAYCTISRIPIPDILTQAFMLILGFYFGSKISFTKTKGG